MRRLWILLVLAGVVSMHGLQVLSIDPSAHQAAISSSMDQMSGSAEGEGVTERPTGFAALQPVSASTTTVASHSEMPPTGHGATEHFWSVCLAVLLAGLAVLGATMLHRRMAAAVVSHRCVFPRWPLGDFRLPRPPDLAALCLLRI